MHRVDHRASTGGLQRHGKPLSIQNATTSSSTCSRSNARRVYGYIYTMLPRWADADDVFQETSRVLWQKFGEFRSGTDFFAWARQVARYQVLYFRQRQQRCRVKFTDAFLDAVAATAADNAEQLEAEQRALAECMEKLKARATRNHLSAIRPRGHHAKRGRPTGNDHRRRLQVAQPHPGHAAGVHRTGDRRAEQRGGASMSLTASQRETLDRLLFALRDDELTQPAGGRVGATRARRRGGHAALSRVANLNVGLRWMTQAEGAEVRVQGSGNDECGVMNDELAAGQSVDRLVHHSPIATHHSSFRSCRLAVFLRGRHGDYGNGDPGGLGVQGFAGGGAVSRRPRCNRRPAAIGDGKPESRTCRPDHGHGRLPLGRSATLRRPGPSPWAQVCPGLGACGNQLPDRSQGHSPGTVQLRSGLSRRRFPFAGQADGTSREGFGVRGQGPEETNPKSQILNQKSLIPNPNPYPLFVVRTPTAVITDLGTEFGVEVDKSGVTHSHVFRGKIEVRPAAGTRQMAARCPWGRRIGPGGTGAEPGGRQ